MSELRYKVLRGQSEDAIHTHSMRGHVNVPYSELLALFGKPSWTAPKGSSRLMWRLWLEEDFEVMIYDWMSDPLPLAEVDKWSVASEDNRGLGAARHILINNIKPTNGKGSDAIETL